jgi:hypothetical protein
MAYEVLPAQAPRLGVSLAEANSQRPLPSPSIDRSDAQTSGQPEQKESLLREARLSTRLRIEIDQLANRYVLKRYLEADPDPVAQYPSESHLRFARAVTAALRAAQLARLDIKA